MARPSLKKPTRSTIKPASPSRDLSNLARWAVSSTARNLCNALVKQQAAILDRYHPKATVWISGQGFDRAAFERFYGLLRLEPDWLSGVFFGPQSRDGLETQRANIPPRYPILFYPDIAHTMHAQFPVPRWDPAFALTEGREPVAPRPRAMTHVT